MGRQALLVLDLINELVHPDGHYAHVCLQQVQQRGVVARAAEAVRSARAAGIPVLHVVLGYSPGYLDWPYGSPLFGEPDPEHRLTIGTWGTRVHAELEPLPGEPVVTKRRVSPFHGTHLELLLRGLDVDTLLLVGVTTDLVVLSTSREAHDRGYRTVVLTDATATQTEQLQRAAELVLARTSELSTVAVALPPVQAPAAAQVPAAAG